MKLKTIMGAALLFIGIICAMPAIAAPPDSPPRAETAKQTIESEMPAPAPNFLVLYAEKSCDTPRTGEYATANYQNERRSYDSVTRNGVTEHYDIGDH